jgi:hypothetical protein
MFPGLGEVLLITTLTQPIVYECCPFAENALLPHSVFLPNRTALTSILLARIERALQPCRVLSTSRIHVVRDLHPPRDLQ